MPTVRSQRGDGLPQATGFSFQNLRILREGSIKGSERKRSLGLTDLLGHWQVLVAAFPEKFANCEPGEVISIIEVFVENHTVTKLQSSDPVSDFYTAMLCVGSTAYVYPLTNVTGHRAALAKALIVHLQAGRSLLNVTASLVHGRCTDPACSCGGRDAAIRYTLHPFAEIEVIHF